MKLPRLSGFLLSGTLLVGCAGNDRPEPPLVAARITQEERGLSRFETGNLREAANNFNQAIRLAELADDPVAVVENKLNLGVTYLYLEQTALAGEVFSEAYQYALRADLPTLKQRALQQMAKWHYRTGQIAEATSLYHQLSDDSGASTSDRMRLSALNGLALCAMSTNNLTNAAHYLDRAERLTNDGMPGLQATTLHNRATLSLRQGDLVRAEQAALNALAKDRARGDTPGLAADLELLGWIHARQEQLDTSNQYFRQATRLYRHLGMKSAVSRLQKQMSAGKTQPRTADR